MGYQHSFVQELLNPATSSRQVNPLVPDFSQMSDPGVIVEPPNIYNQHANNASLTRLSCKEQSKRSLSSKKKRRHRSSSFSSTSRSTSSDSYRRSKKSKRLRHSHKKRRRSPSPSLSSRSTQSQNDFGRYKRDHTSPQVAEAPVPVQPAEPLNISPVNISPVNIAQSVTEHIPQTSKDSGSDFDAEIWSFDRAINEVFRLLPQELCPKTQQEKTPAKPLSGIEHLMESHSIPFLVLPQSNLVENTSKFVQNRIVMEKCCRDWICPQTLVTFLAPTKFYKSQNQFFPMDNIPPLEADASLLDLSNRGKASIPIKNLEAWEKKVRKLIAINSQADLFSSTAYLCRSILAASESVLNFRTVKFLENHNS